MEEEIEVNDGRGEKRYRFGDLPTNVIDRRDLLQIHRILITRPQKSKDRTSIRVTIALLRHVTRQSPDYAIRYTRQRIEAHWRLQERSSALSSLTDQGTTLPPTSLSKRYPNVALIRCCSARSRFTTRSVLSQRAPLIDSRSPHRFLVKFLCLCETLLSILLILLLSSYKTLFIFIVCQFLVAFTNHTVQTLFICIYRCTSPLRTISCCILRINIPALSRRSIRITIIRLTRRKRSRGLVQFRLA